MFPLMETIKIKEGIPQYLDWHQWRFEKSFFLHYLKPAPFDLKQLIQVPEEFKKGIVKLRFLYNEVDCFCQYSPYTPRKINSLQLVTADDLEYSLKYVNRQPIEDLQKRKGSSDDILIIKNEQISDTSFTNIVFFDGKQWVTPAYPLLKGTARERLLYEKKIFAKEIRPEDIKNYKTFKLINAMLDFEEQEEIPATNIYY